MRHARRKGAVFEKLAQAVGDGERLSRHGAKRFLVDGVGVEPVRMDQEALNDVDQWADAGREIGDKRRMLAGIGHAAMIRPSARMVGSVPVSRTERFFFKLARGDLGDHDGSQIHVGGALLASGTTGHR
jgi:hypothetical protein